MHDVYSTVHHNVYNYTCIRTYRPTSEDGNSSCVAITDIQDIEENIWSPRYTNYISVRMLSVGKVTKGVSDQFTVER